MFPCRLTCRTEGKIRGCISDIAVCSIYSCIDMEMFVVSLPSRKTTMAFTIVLLVIFLFITSLFVYVYCISTFFNVHFGLPTAGFFFR